MSDPRRPERPQAAAKTGLLRIRIGTAPMEVAPPGPSPRQQAWLAYKAELEGCLAQYDDHAMALSERTVLLRFVLQLHERPKEQRAGALDDMRADQRVLAQALLVRLRTETQLHAGLLQVVQRYEAVGAAFGDVAVFLGQTEDEAGPAAMAAADAPKVPHLRGLLYSLTTFDLLFRHDPVLSHLFPTRERKAARGGQLPAATPAAPGSTHPAEPTPRPVPTLPTPPPLGEMLGGLVKRITGVHPPKR